MNLERVPGFFWNKALCDTIREIIVASRCSHGRTRDGLITKTLLNEGFKKEFVLKLFKEVDDNIDLLRLNGVKAAQAGKKLRKVIMGLNKRGKMQKVY